MKRIAILVGLILTLFAAPARAIQAVDYFNQGLKSSLAYKKIEYFSKALELDPNFAPAYAKRGIIYYFQEKYENVVRDYGYYVKLVPDEADARRMLGMGLLKTGSLDAAVKNFTAALKLDPNLAAAYCYRGEAYRLKGAFQKAIADATRAAKLSSDPRTIAAAYVVRAKTYRSLGEYDLAGDDVRRSLEIDPRYGLYRYVANYASLESMRHAGLLGIIVLSFAMIFKVTIPRPKKDD